MTLPAVIHPLHFRFLSVNSQSKAEKTKFNRAEPSCFGAISFRLGAIRFDFGAIRFCFDGLSIDFDGFSIDSDGLSIDFVAIKNRLLAVWYGGQAVCGR